VNLCLFSLHLGFIEKPKPAEYYGVINNGVSGVPDTLQGGIHRFHIISKVFCQPVLLVVTLFPECSSN
jgi:hypothetical protein